MNVQQCLNMVTSLLKGENTNVLLVAEPGVVLDGNFHLSDFESDIEFPKQYN